MNGSAPSVSPGKLSNDSIVTETDQSFSRPASATKSVTQAYAAQVHDEKPAHISVSNIEDSESRLHDKKDFNETEFTLNR